MYGVVKFDKKRPLREVTNIFNDEYRALDVYLIELFKENCMKQKCCKNRIRFRDYNVKKRLAWCKVKRHKTVNDFWKPFFYFELGGHLGWKSGSPNTILEGGHPRIISAKFG